jgi:hypothetical protein
MSFNGTLSPKSQKKLKDVHLENPSPTIIPRPGTPESVHSTSTIDDTHPTLPPKPLIVDKPPPIEVDKLQEYVAKKKTNMDAFEEEYKVYLSQLYYVTETAIFK